MPSWAVWQVSYLHRMKWEWFFRVESMSLHSQIRWRYMRIQSRYIHHLSERKRGLMNSWAKMPLPTITTFFGSFSRKKASSEVMICSRPGIFGTTGWPVNKKMRGLRCFAPKDLPPTARRIYLAVCSWSLITTVCLSFSCACPLMTFTWLSFCVFS